jgi:hypothetical protein
VVADDPITVRRQQDNVPKGYMAPPETIEQGHPILRRNHIAKGIFHRYVAEIQEMTSQEVIHIQVHEDKPSDIVRISDMEMYMWLM